VMGLGPCGERAHLLRSVVVTRRALYQRPEGRDMILFSICERSSHTVWKSPH